MSDTIWRRPNKGEHVEVRVRVGPGGIHKWMSAVVVMASGYKAKARITGSASTFAYELLPSGYPEKWRFEE